MPNVHAASYDPSVCVIHLHPDDAASAQFAPRFVAMSGKLEQVSPGRWAVVYVHPARQQAKWARMPPPRRRDELE